MPRTTSLAVLLIFLFIWLIIISITLGDYGIAWDEPLYFRAATLYISWSKLLLQSIKDRKLGLPFSKEVIESYWYANCQHPPLPKLVAGLSHLLLHKISNLDEIIAYRAGNLIWVILLFFSVYLLTKHIYNNDHKKALFSAISVLFLPRIFAHAHLVELDLPLASLWTFTLYAFLKGLDNWKWSILCGISFGFALLTKLTAWFMLIPILIYSQIYARGKYTNNLFSMLFLGIPLFILFWPWLWHDMPTKLVDYFAFFFLMKSPLKTFYFGKAYSQTPFHYPFFITLVTIPASFLVLFLLGYTQEPKRTDHKLLIFNIIFLLVFFSLPGTLVIDGERYFLPVFPLLLVYSGAGFDFLTKVLSFRVSPFSALFSEIQIQQLDKTKYRLLPVCILILLVYLPIAVSLWKLHPCQLSYFNELIFGIKGAHRLGLETTYWGEVLGPKERAWINDNFKPFAKAKFMPFYPVQEKASISALSFYPDVVVYYQQKGYLRPDIDFFSQPPYDYIILISREGLFTDFCWQLYKKTHPSYSVSLSGVQLVGIYPLVSGMILNSN